MQDADAQVRVLALLVVAVGKELLLLGEEERGIVMRMIQIWPFHHQRIRIPSRAHRWNRNKKLRFPGRVLCGSFRLIVVGRGRKQEQVGSCRSCWIAR